METVYLETTFVSYLVALPARDLVIAAHIAIATVHRVQYLLTWNCRHWPMPRSRGE